MLGVVIREPFDPPLEVRNLAFVGREGPEPLEEILCVLSQGDLPVDQVGEGTCGLRDRAPKGPNALEVVGLTREEMNERL